MWLIIQMWIGKIEYYNYLLVTVSKKINPFLLSGFTFFDQKTIALNFDISLQERRIQ